MVAVSTAVLVTLVLPSWSSADVTVGAYDLPVASDATNAASVAISVASLATAIANCPRCGFPLLGNGRCRNCGLTLSNSLLPHVRSTPGRVRTDIRSIRQTTDSFNRTMRNINESVRNMNRDITRMRNLNRRFP
jgi:hypothetical protein